jgi:hypothetical protein
MLACYLAPTIPWVIGANCKDRRSKGPFYQNLFLQIRAADAAGAIAAAGQQTNMSRV